MKLQKNILLILGVICSVIGVVAKLLSLERIHSDYLLILGLFSVLLGGGFSVYKNNQSKKYQVVNWIYLFVIIIIGILFYLRIW